MEVPQETIGPIKRWVEREVPALPNYRTGIDWDTMPDWSLLDLAQVCLLCGLAPAVVHRRMKEGQFPRYSRHGRKKYWSLGAIRQWCLDLSAGKYEAGGGEEVEEE